MWFMIMMTPGESMGLFTDWFAIGSTVTMAIGGIALIALALNFALMSAYKWVEDIPSTREVGVVRWISQNTKHDGDIILLHSMGTGFVLFLLSPVWPLFLFISVTYGTLLLVRSIRRTQKRVSVLTDGERS